MAREISRQTFLRGAAGALAAGAVFGSVRATAAPNPSGWDGLSTAIGGKVLLPDGPQFATAKQVFNTLYNDFTPAAIVTPTSPADVQKAMAFAAAHNLKVAPRSGGHSYVGGSTANGAMVLDLRQLPGDINYDAATGQVTVTPATSLYALHQALAAAGRGIPTGTCPSVGAAGHALGGGLGAHSRHAGLMCDALTSASVVLPGGQAVTASATNNPDLFWALRGGGGGNFGVTTSLPSPRSPPPSRRREPQFPAAVVRAGPRRLAELAADRRPKQLGTGRCHVDRWGRTAASWRPARPGRVTGGGGHRFRRRHATDRNREPHVQLFGPGQVSGREPQPVAARLCRRFRCFRDDHSGRRKGHRLGGRRLSAGAGRMLTIMHALDGALATVAPGATAFPWRRHSALVQWYVEPSGYPSAATAWLNTAHQAVQPYSVGGYVNYIEANQPPSRYFGPNLSQLSAARQKYDPGRVMFSGLNF